MLSFSNLNAAGCAGHFRQPKQPLQDEGRVRRRGSSFIPPDRTYFFDTKVPLLTLDTLVLGPPAYSIGLLTACDLCNIKINSKFNEICKTKIV